MFLGTDEYYMQEALKQAKLAYEKDEVPVGAVIVFENRIIAKSHNQVETLKDPTAHAEMIAITQATSELSSKWLNDCSLYVTIEPCSMCAGAIVLARINNVFFGAKDPKTGACGSVFDIACSSKLNHNANVFYGLMHEECSAIISSFFLNKRKT